jgi:hypothetical protein
MSAEYFGTGRAGFAADDPREMGVAMTASRFTYQARDQEEYLELLFTDPRPWWTEAKPRKKPRLKNKLTNMLSSSATKPRARDAVKSLV